MTGGVKRGDDALMASIAGGDREAFGDLMRRHLPAVLNFSRQYLPADAEDISQEAFIRLWNRAPEWQERGISPKAWLLRTSYNLCIDVLRRNKNEVLDEQQKAALTDPRDSCERRLSAQSDLAQQMALLQALPERQRQAILLCAMSGLNNIEAAAVMDISVEALESLLSRGRRTLKRAFSQATGYEPGGHHDDD